MLLFNLKLANKRNCVAIYYLIINFLETTKNGFAPLRITGPYINRKNIIFIPRIVVPMFCFENLQN